jgi:arylsulfatase A-like enzyme
VHRAWIRENHPELLEKEKLTQADITFEMAHPYYPSERGFDETWNGRWHRFWANYTLDGEDIEYQFVKDDRYRLDVQSDAAVTFINRHHDEPFFLYLPYFAPHVPLEATEEYLARFPGEMPKRRRYCLAMLSAIDDGVGRIRETLREHGIEENTLIFYISDNGAPLWIHKEDITLEYKGGAWDGSENTPLVGEKGMISEGGIRVPFLAAWPAVLPAGMTYHEPVISLDVAATSVAVAGLEQPEELDGVNLVPYLTGEKSGPPHDYLFWRFWGQTAVRSGQWKFLKAGPREYLFKLGPDGVEKDNVIGEHPEKARELKEKLDAWADELSEPGVPGGINPKEKEWYDFYFPAAD